MTELPDFSPHGYTAEALLGSNEEGGRLTYRAVAADSGERVVIKRFAFASKGASWAGYRAHEREIQVLRELSHPRIPAYIDAFSTDDGFCLVQSALDVPSLAERMSFETREIKTIALSVLDILIDLQERIPPIIHRDLKPDNILIDDACQAYLVDFGLASTDRESSSTIATGTPGFMPPEQMLGRKLTRSSDLFALGATLIALLSGTRSSDLSDLLGVTNAFDLSVLPPNTSQGFRAWIERMVAPDPAARFPDARAALEALVPLDLTSPHAAPPSSGTTRPHQSDASPSLAPLIAFILLLGVAIVGGLAVLYNQSMDEQHALQVEAEAEAEAQASQEARALEEARQREAKRERKERVEREALLAAQARPAEETITCKEAMTLEDVDIQNRELDAIVAYAGCDLTVEGGSIHAPDVITLFGDARVTLSGLTLASDKGQAIQLRSPDAELTMKDSRLDARVIAADVMAGTLRLERSTLKGPIALSVGAKGEVFLDATTTLNGQHDAVEEGGWIYGLDSPADARRLREQRYARYAAKACAGVLACYKSHDHEGAIDLELRTTIDATGQPSRVKISGEEPPKAIRACLEDASARSIPDYHEADGGGVLRCTIDATLSDFMTQMKGSHSEYLPASSCKRIGDACDDEATCCEGLTCEKKPTSRRERLESRAERRDALREGRAYAAPRRCVGACRSSGEPCVNQADCCGGLTCTGTLCGVTF